MSKYIKDLNQTQQNIQSNSSNVVSNSGVQKYSAGKEKIAAVKSKITVPMYFYNIMRIKPISILHNVNLE